MSLFGIFDIFKKDIAVQHGAAGAGFTVPVTHDSTGMFPINLDALPQTMTYNGPGGTLDTITVGPDQDGNYYRQTLTYTGSNVTGVSAWVKL